jgi:type IV pilus assembly protein PilV
MVAILIMMVGLLALLQSINIAINQNMTSFKRDEGVRIAEQKLNESRKTPFASMAFASYTVNRNMRSFVQKYAVFQTVSSFSSTKKIRVRVTWTHKGTQYQHQVSSMRTIN